ncbi:MAG TPA: TNT domain-containing protein [Micromonospora sp.]
MKLTRSVLAVLAGAALGLAQPATVQAGELSQPVPSRAVQALSAQLPELGGGAADPSRPGERGEGAKDSSRCRQGYPDLAPKTRKYYDDNELLGPARLPRKRPVGPLIEGYQRFGKLTEQQFVAKYIQNGKYVYPPKDGYVLDGKGNPVKYRTELTVGTRIDRFGFPGGKFLAPLGTPFAERSLPPQNLNTPEGASLANYHRYCVIKPFPVDTGPIAPWFGQPGLGAQYQLNPAYLPQAGQALTVDWLLHYGYLVEERPSLKREPCEGTASELCHLLESLRN